jgi:L-rhamnose-H+ transport protein
MEAFLGIVVVAAGGLVMGSSAWPFKLMKKYQFEHWWFVGMLVGLVIMPWAITLLGCPGAIEGLKNIPRDAILLGNLFSVGWGIANVLCGICYVRIGVALTGAILAGLGVSVGAITPMIFKGSGLFKDAPDVTSQAGITVCLAIGLMLVGVVFASLAGFGRDRELKKSSSKSSSKSSGFLTGLVMTVLAGILSSFMSFVFVYSQDPIVANLSRVGPDTDLTVTVDGEKLTDEAMRSLVDPIGVQGKTAWEIGLAVKSELNKKSPGSDPDVTVSTGSIPATFGVFAIGLIGGAVVNLGYAAFLLTRNRSWNVLLGSVWELFLAVLIGVGFSLAVALMGKGMLLLGALGASVGFGIQQAMQMTGTQLLGFVSGEWRGVYGTPRKQMYLALAVLLVASIIMAYGNGLAKS